VGTRRVKNRWAIQPMEGWDGTPEGNPSEHTLRRWRNFGRSGAGLIWGGEAVAVRPDGRANPHQLLLSGSTIGGLARLRRALLEAHQERFGGAAELLVGLQLTHSGRFARSSENRPAPRIAYRHPLLDRRVGVEDDRAVLTDAEVEALIGDFARAAAEVRELGFDFVDLKHCHGYLLHEFLGAHTRAGRYGGSFENRTRILRELTAAVRRDAPGMEIGVRVSVFDLVPFRPDPASSRPGAPGPGVPEEFTAHLPYRFGFGVDPGDPTRPDLSEGIRFLECLRELGIRLVNVSAGSPYYTPHIQRPAAFPPSDGYLPPEDPLEGVVRQLRAARDLKARFPDLLVVGSGLSYLQDYLPHVAQAVVREGWMDFAGIGRMVLSYPELPADCLERGALERKRICRTFSDCTTAPRNGLVSGCYPLDSYYGDLPEAEVLEQRKAERRRSTAGGK
jgi:2,4-dienoyl-CoA reductase-like NADH-dependent reductase (Old Yellow Enzyme family)